MDIKVLSKEDNKIVFVLKDANNVFANTLRRTMIAEVASLAIKRVTFVKNSSALFDDIVAHRLGLVPLITDLDSYILPEECSCKGAGCAKCQLIFTLKAEGPLTVYASDLKSQDPKIKPVFGKMPIVQLLKGQELEFEAVATLGTGKEHAKYIPGLVHYKGVPKITLNKVRNTEQVKSSCPVFVYEMEGKNLKVTDNEKCTLCNSCIEEAEPEGSVNVEASTKDFIFYVESFGKLSPQEMLSRALDVVDKKLELFQEAIKA